MRGLLVELGTPEQLTDAVRRLRRLGYKRLDTFTPFPLDDVEEALHLPESPVAPIVFVAGLLGAAAGYLVQWWTAAVDYPLDVGGFPPHSAPAFIPATFETMILFASVAAFLSVFVLAQLPRWWHPLFEVEGFDRATVDRFFLFVDADDRSFGPEKTRAELEALIPIRVEPVGEEVAG